MQRLVCTVLRKYQYGKWQYIWKPENIHLLRNFFVKSSEIQDQGLPHRRFAAVAKKGRELAGYHIIFQEFDHFTQFIRFVKAKLFTVLIGNKHAQ